MVADMQEVIDKIQPIFAEALLDAGAARQTATKNTAENGGVKYQTRPFAEQVDEVLSGTYDRTNAVYMGETPKILGKVGLNGDLPMLTTARHLKNASMPKNAKKHHHGLTEGQLKRLPQAIANPVIILDSLGTIPNSIVVVTDMLDPDKLPVIVAIRTDGTGMYNNVEIDTNFVLSYYGRTEFVDYLDRHITAGNLLYYNKEKSETLSNRANVQFVGQLDAYRSDTILRKTKAKVNRKNSFRNATAIDAVFVEENGRRYSDRSRKTAAALERENKRLKEDVKYLRELVRLQKKVTNGTRMKRTDVESMAKLLTKNDKRYCRLSATNSNTLFS